MKTTAEERKRMREAAKARVGTAASVCWDSVQMLYILNDFAALEAEMDALRRVEAEDLHACHWRSQCVDDDEPPWMVHGGSDTRTGRGVSLPAALADYDAKKGMMP